MKTDFIYELTKNFETHAQHTSEGTEFWLARDLQKLLGYGEWRNFLNVISKAKIACETSGHEIPHHFVDANKTIQMPSSIICNQKQLYLMNMSLIIKLCAILY